MLAVLCPHYGCSLLISVSSYVTLGKKESLTLGLGKIKVFDGITSGFVDGEAKMSL
ncbi:hypothetical protein [Calothrix sp. NIES-2100]|uniref:hypothetical protein n=1 Tax=Calothrix sp. NIES-2100 TaxID=1954172 RepID=UPI0030D871AC